LASDGLLTQYLIILETLSGSHRSDLRAFLGLPGTSLLKDKNDGLKSAEIDSALSPSPPPDR